MSRPKKKKASPRAWKKRVPSSRPRLRRPLILFHPGQMVMTPAIPSSGITPQEIAAAVTRHLAGDWGDVGADLASANAASLSTRGPILSSYLAASGLGFFILTEPDKGTTTIMLPEEFSP